MSLKNLLCQELGSYIHTHLQTAISTEYCRIGNHLNAAWVAQMTVWMVQNFKIQWLQLFVSDMYCVGLPYCDDETHLATEQRTVEANAWNREGGVANCTLMR